MKFIYRIVFRLLLLLVLILTCGYIDEVPRDRASGRAVFGNEQGLQSYINSLYDWLPGANDIIRVDYVSDYGARRDVPPLLRGGVGPTTSDDTSQSGWNRVSLDRKSTRLNSSHVAISYAVFCLKKKKYKYLV